MEFMDRNRELVVITTVTNWDEPPRIRHEIAWQLSRFYNVLFIQVYCQRGMTRKRTKVNDYIAVDRAGLCFPGIFRLMLAFPPFMWAYNCYLSVEVARLVKSYGYSKSILCNFQFNFPQIHKRKEFYGSIYFCNEDFVNQDEAASDYIKLVKRNEQLSVLRNSNFVLTVSEPLNKILSSACAAKVHTILSGHGFDTGLSRQYYARHRPSAFLRICYLGFLSEAIAINWLEAVCNQNDMQLTIIGPISNLKLIANFKDNLNFKHIESLTGADLQIELLRHDVLLMPYASVVDNEVTSAPAKLFQYLATGKPIISSVMPNLIKMPPYFVYQSESESDFMNNVRVAATADNEDYFNERLAFADENSWNSRGNYMQALINKYFCSKS